MKSYTDIEQSKKLAEILPLEKEHNISFSEEMEWLDNLKYGVSTLSEYHRE